ncbi:hypothetical protein ACFQJD_10170 [Haloplanus sp. GCM10025708]|uniref:hypothetical protein n=1 Tax=Haloferacaceae TaxID=1644056 RepID=UPI003619044D
MASHTRETGLSHIFRFLVAYRIVIYLGGLVAIGVPLFLARAFDYHVSAGARTAIVLVSLAVMIVTYVGERRVGDDHIDDRTGKSVESYSLRMRLSVGLAVLGIAVGVYVAVEMHLVAGLLFVLGAYLFGYLGYRSEGTDGD